MLNLAAYVERHACQPDGGTRVAVRVLGVGETVTYVELHEMASHQATRIAAIPAGRVGLYVPRGIEAVVKLIACEMAERSHAFLYQRDMPQDLLSQMAREASLTAVLTEHHDDIAPIDRIGPPRQGPSGRDDLSSEAYVTYTSGTTGSPKGIAVTRRSLEGYLNWAIGLIGDGFRSSLLCTPLRFDLSVPAVYLPLMGGGTLNILPQPLNIRDLARALQGGLGEEWTCDFVRMTPTILGAMLDASTSPVPFSGARTFMIGGEPLPEKLAVTLRRRAPNVHIVNHYGPAEAVVGTTAHRFERARGHETVPLGAPRPDRPLRIRTEDMGLVKLTKAEVGVRGELVIGGPGLGRYLSQEARAESPGFIEVDGTELYSSGDLVEVLADHQLLYRGRTDRQVKVAGVRVELDGVEHALRQCSGVDEVAVVALDSGRLGALVTPESVDLQSIRESVSETLEPAAIPRAFQPVSSLPVGASGKIDYTEVRSQLEQSVRERSGRIEGRGRSPLEALRAIWCDLLLLDSVDSSDDFFEVGGDSLLAIRMISLAQKSGFDLSPRDVIECPRLGELAGRARATSELGEQQRVEPGLGSPTPLQLRTLEVGAHKEAYGFTVMLELHDADHAVVADALDRTLLAHPALTQMFVRRTSSWEAQLSAAHGSVTVVPGEEISEERLLEFAKERCAPAEGRSVIGIWSPRGQLGLFFHHLVLDAISLGVFLSTFDRALSDPDWRPEPDAFGHWFTHIRALSESPVATATAAERRLAELAAAEPWRMHGAQPGPVVQELLRDREMPNLSRVAAIKSGRRYVEAILVAAAAEVMEEYAPWAPDRIPVLVEGHGRAPINGVNLLDTVGWLTTLEPVVLEGSLKQASTGGRVRSALQQLGDVDSAPHGYLAEVANESSDPRRWYAALACVNYLGELLNDEERHFKKIGRYRVRFGPAGARSLICPLDLLVASNGRHSRTYRIRVRTTQYLMDRTSALQTLGSVSAVIEGKSVQLLREL